MIGNLREEIIKDLKQELLSALVKLLIGSALVAVLALVSIHFNIIL